MTINVTEEDIATGSPEDCERCPIALALQRTLRTASIVYVNGVYAEIDGCKYELPVGAKSFIDGFDSGYPVSPISFDMPVEDEL